MHDVWIYAGFHDSDIICVKYIDTIGGKWPTPQRGHWFSNPNDVSTLRQKIDKFCNIKHESTSALSTNNVNLLIYIIEYKFLCEIIYIFDYGFRHWIGSVK